MYKVMIPFCDGENGKPYPANRGGVSYAVGDVYPKGDFKPTEAHLAYLLSAATKMGRPVIEEILEEPKPEDAPKAKTTKK